MKTNFSSLSSDDFYFRSEKLDEKDVDIDEEERLEKTLTNQIKGQSQLPLDTDDVISSSQSNVRSSQEEEEYNIEDYED